jgi:hypothetical protein
VDDYFTATVKLNNEVIATYTKHHTRSDAWDPFFINAISNSFKGKPKRAVLIGAGKKIKKMIKAGACDI